MPKKKTNYEKKGFARKLSSRIFKRRDKSSKPEDQWRPRKAKFEVLQADDDDDFSAPTIINNLSFSVESETGGYKRDIMDRKKQRAIRKMNKKTDFEGISIQPSSRDKHTNSTRKKQRTDTNGFPLSSNASIDQSLDSRQSASTRQTTMSDPTNFFSSKPAALTRNNLDKLTRDNELSSEIENENPRSKFHQFTIDEDKESTVIMPIGFDDDETTNDRTFDDDVSSSRYSGSRHRHSSFERAFTPFKDGPMKTFDSFASSKENIHGSLPSAPSFQQANDENVRSNHRSSKLSVTSLCYSPSPKYESQAFGLKNQHQRFIRDGRTPLSPLNGVRAPLSGTKSSFQKRNDDISGLGSWSDFVHDTSSNNNSGFKSTDNVSDIFEDRSRSVQVFESRNGGQSKWGQGLNNGFSNKTKPINSFDSADSEGTFRPRLEEEVPVGIQSFECASRGSLSAPSSIVSAASQGKFMYNHGGRRVTALSFDDDDDVSHSHHSVRRSPQSHYSNGRSSHGGGSTAKPTGLPSNAIMASMLFQRHHKIDTRVVEAKLKAKREESSKSELNRGDVPRAIPVQDDMYSCVSSFSEDTSSVGPWKKPTRDLLDHFASSRRTELHTGRFRREQQLAKAPTLFEA